MELDESKKFLLYTLGTGFLLILLACILQLCLVPGSDCSIPFFTNPDPKTYIYAEPPEYNLSPGSDYQAVLYTSEGNITLDLFEQNAPQTVNNFVFLATEGYYDGVKVHLLINDFAFQTGSRNSLDSDYSDDGEGGPGYTVPDEVNWDSLDIPQRQRVDLEALGYISAPNLQSRPIKEYSLMMANSGEGGTGGSQFIIITADSNDTRLIPLRGKHTVFGEVIDGFSVVDSINMAEVEFDDTSEDSPYPKDEIVIEFVDILEVTSNGVLVNGDTSERTTRNQNLTSR
ncbi:peptidylprolyl isomerase [Candidatus Dojkabacteria bacterium]|uniref:Peptidyl-prolyl cis-trans isomerase n=1 Tax=Candidatus Dojkabacteria bacterium TaxID=2099670 RepID=A0A955RKU9_9BACT|nr:peptidylprolyl isomerase [Candidatus Dojkabacteria bacterium]